MGLGIGKGRVPVAAGDGAPAAGRREASRRAALHGGMTLRERAIIVFLIVLIAVVALLSLLAGDYDMAPMTVVTLVGRYLAFLVTSLPARVASIFGMGPAPVFLTSQDSVVLFVIRIPRIALGALTGAALAASGAAYQGMFRNPMVSPDILGVSNGAALGAAVSLLLGLPSVAVHAVSFLMGLLAVGLVMLIAKIIGRDSRSIVVIILAGTVMSSMFSALVSLCKYLADPDDTLPAITYWLMGSFSRSGTYANIGFLAGVVLVAGGALIAVRWRINALSFGDDEAKTMGVGVRSTRAVLIVAATLLTSATVSFCGVVGWIGLIIPHMARLVVGPNYRVLLPVSMLGGAAFTMIVDDVARVIVPGEMPAGVLTALIGAPLFIYLLVRGRKEWL